MMMVDMFHLAFVTLLSPWMLAGLGLLSLPIIAHLLNRRIKRRVMFPTLMLLSQTAATRKSFEHVRRWLLLALRCLAVALLVLAFTRPWWVGETAKAATIEQATATVIVVDLSASMQQIDANGLKVSQRMRDAVEDVINSLEPGVDVANIVVTDDGNGLAAAIYPQLSGNLEGLTSEAVTLKPGPMRVDLPAAITTATRMLSEFAGQRRLVIVSDMQASNWADMTPSATATAMQPLQAQDAARQLDIELINVMADRSVATNHSVSNLRTIPANPVAGQPCVIVATLANPNPKRTSATWSLVVADEPALRFTQQLEPGERRVLRVPMTFEEAGMHRMRLSIEEDGLAIDNKDEAWVSVRNKQPVTIVTDDGFQRPGTAAYYLARALAPNRRGSGRFEVSTMNSQTLENAEPAGVVFVTDVSSLAAPAIETLQRDMRQGGAVVYMLGDGAVVSNVAALSGGVVTAGALRSVDGQVKLQQGEWESPWLDIFKGRSRIALQRMYVGKLWELNAGQEADVVLRYSDGTPAIILQSFVDEDATGPIASGRLVIVNIALQRDWSDLATSGLIVPVAQHLAVALEDATSSSTGRRQAVVGEAIIMTAKPLANAGEDATVSILDPDGERVVGGKIDMEQGDVQAVVGRTEQVGVYTLMQGDTMLATRSVGVDTREGELQTADVESIQDMLRVSAGAKVSESNASGLGGPVYEDQPIELWGWAIVAAAMLLLVESGLLGWWRR